MIYLDNDKIIYEIITVKPNTLTFYNGSVTSIKQVVINNHKFFYDKKRMMSKEYDWSGFRARCNCRWGYKIWRGNLMASYLDFVKHSECAPIQLEFTYD
jgi:hypothetical protein